MRHVVQDKVGHGNAMKKDGGGGVVGRGSFEDDHKFNLGTKIILTLTLYGGEYEKQKGQEEEGLS